MISSCLVCLINLIITTGKAETSPSTLDNICKEPVESVETFIIDRPNNIISHERTYNIGDNCVQPVNNNMQGNNPPRQKTDMKRLTDHMLAKPHTKDEDKNKVTRIVNRVYTKNGRITGSHFTSHNIIVDGYDSDLNIGCG